MQDLYKHIFPGDDKIFADEFLCKLNTAINNLPEENGKAILLHFQEKISRKEIAQQLDWSLSKVNTKITRGLSLLKWQLNPAAFESAIDIAHKLMEQKLKDF